MCLLFPCKGTFTLNIGQREIENIVRSLPSLGAISSLNSPRCSFSLSVNALKLCNFNPREELNLMLYLIGALCTVT